MKLDSKALSITLTAALLTTLAGGGYLYLRNQSHQKALAEQLGTRTAEVEQFRSQLGDTSSKLDHASAELVRTSADLSQATEQLAKSRAESEAIAGMQARLLKLTNSANTELADAWEQAGAAQQKLFDEPSHEAFTNLKNGIARAQNLVKACRTQADELEAFLLTSESLLARSAADVAAVRTRMADAKSQFDAIGVKLDETSASLREARFTALANEGWTGTDVSVSDGEVLAISASGQWRFARGDQGLSGPEGENASPAVRLAPQVPNGALIARFRGSQLVHKALGGIQPDRAGKLELRINDTTGSDNDGTMEVTLFAFKPIQ